MWNDLSANLKYSGIYLKEIILLDSVVILIILLLEERIYITLPLAFLILLFSLIFLSLIGKKRSTELSEIKEIIKHIRENYYSGPEEINLSTGLSSLQEEIRRMFEKAKADIEYLKKLEKMRTEFLANVSHELRTPIFAIQGYIETLLSGAINDEKVNKTFLEKADRHTLNLNNLLNDLIDISRIESGEMRMSFRYFNINEALRTVVQEFEPMASEKKISLLFHPGKENLQLWGDKQRLRLVIVNLLTNAIKYTEEGTVEVFVEDGPKYGKIIVKDTGIGIPADDLDRIFERFYRVDKGRSRLVGGTGLGLAIVKHIVEAHGSKVEVKSEPGKGSEFSFKLRK
ncbi:MAG TPA: ATP-binding protein [Ignavibacteriaceae bacterium]|nr:ATP-binding protein [Ignavibacteriaceae bacterium]